MQSKVDEPGPEMKCPNDGPSQTTIVRSKDGKTSLKCAKCGYEYARGSEGLGR